MSIGEVLNYLIIGVGVVVALLASLFGGGVLLHLSHRYGQLIAPAFSAIIVSGIAVGAALSKRSLTFASTDIESISAGAGGGDNLLRLCTFLVVGFSAAKVGTYLLAQKRAPVLAGGAGLFAAFVAFFVGNVVLPSAFGTHPAFVHSSIYPVFVFAALYAARTEPLETIVRVAKLALLALMVLSLVAAAAKPSLAVQPGYHGWIPGLNIRLWGLGSNPNSIGPLALLSLLLEVLQPSRRNLLRIAAIGSAGAVLVLSQSKTAWLAGIATLPFFAWYRFGRLGEGRVDIRFVLGVIATIIFAVGALAFVDLGRIWHKIMLTQSGADIMSLTGRGKIWLVALAEWRASPWFGYGIEAWGAQHRLDIGLPFAFSAHNQFLQSLSVGGVFGLVSFVVYLVALGWAALRFGVQSKGVSVALFLVILLRSMTEAPYAFGTILNGDFLTHLLLFSLCLRCAAAPRVVAPCAPRTLPSLPLPHPIQP